MGPDPSGTFDALPPALESDWTLVVAVSRNGVIGRGEALPWKLRSDLQRFKRLTMGHCLLMGRKTYDSIGRPLPGRQTIVLSRTVDQPPAAGYQVASNLGQVSAMVEPQRRVMVVGGAEVYRQILDEHPPRCGTILLTRVQADVEGDTYFPTIDWQHWSLDARQSVPAGPHDEWPSEFQVWTRRNTPS